MAKQSQAQAAEAVGAVKKQTIYMGPTKPGLKSNSIYIGRLPDTAVTMINRDGRYKRLFVPLSEFPKALKDLKEGGLAEIYKAASRECF